MSDHQQQIKGLLFDLLPRDGSTVGNVTLLGNLRATAATHGLTVDDVTYHAARDALVGAGRAVKGRGRGGSTARAPTPASDDVERPDFVLAAQDVPPELPFDKPTAIRKPAAKPSQTQSGDAQVSSYRFPDRRVNNPEVGLVSEKSDPERPKTTWAYDPHLDPDLRFDPARAKAETLIDDALGAGDPAAMRAALEELKRMGAPHLQWAGKAERTNFQVDTVSLHVHERIDPMSILAAVSRAQGQTEPGKKGKPHGAIQPGLFEAPFESLPLRDAVDFYRHDKGWSNRLVAGDSLLVMNSLLVKEGMAGQVQMIYVDPPYGIKYGSNFQPFVNKRVVKDRDDDDLTQEPEMIKAFRDTWELGLHSYLTYLRDRLLLTRELLKDSGSVFVQISDDNLHHVRELLDGVFGAKNFVSIIAFTKAAGGLQASNRIGAVLDYIVWYAKDAEKMAFKRLFTKKDSPIEEGYTTVCLPGGYTATMKQLGIVGRGDLPKGSSLAMSVLLTKPGPGAKFAVPHQGREFDSRNRWWGTTREGIDRVIKSQRAIPTKSSIRLAVRFDEFPYGGYQNLWSGLGGAAGPIYVVQTNSEVVERCLLMTTNPGDLVLDPTCGSGTTAYVAEKWGRRWITCDTSRVAVTLAKTRLMTASFDYYELRYPHEGLKGGFIYKAVPHVTLRSIANNPEIDSIHDRLQPVTHSALKRLNVVLSKHSKPLGFTAPEGVRKGMTLDFLRGDVLEEWEVPFNIPESWPEAARDAFDAFHAARRRTQNEMDRSIAAHADSETLYDEPEKAKNRLRITGPFSVEAVPFPTVLNLDETETESATSTAFTADTAVARSGATNRHAQWRDELMKTGIRGKGGQMLKFTTLDTLAGTTCLHCSGSLDTGEPVVLSFGPEHGALEQRQVEHAIGEAGELFPRPKMIVFCAFAFDPEAAKDIDAFKGITALKAQMNTDLLTEDLKKARSSNQSFWLMGQPDVLVRRMKDGQWQVEVNGFDYFDTVKGELVSGGKSRIAMWSLDTDYDGRSLFPHQVFFPMAGSGEGWSKLKKDIRAELDEDKLKAFQGTVSLAFDAGANRRAAVKIVDDRGIESLKVLTLTE